MIPLRIGPDTAHVPGFVDRMMSEREIERFQMIDQVRCTRADFNLGRYNYATCAPSVSGLAQSSIPLFVPGSLEQYQVDPHTAQSMLLKKLWSRPAAGELASMPFRPDPRYCCFRFRLRFERPCAAAGPYELACTAPAPRQRAKTCSGAASAASIAAAAASIAAAADPIGGVGAEHSAEAECCEWPPPRRIDAY